MSPSTEDLGNAALQLTPAARVALVERILDSLDVPDKSLDAQWANESQDRLAAYRRGEIGAVPLAQVLSKYRANPVR